MTSLPDIRATARPSLIRSGGWPFLLTGFAGRLPSSMVQLGYLMVLTAAGRGMAAGGLAVAAVGLGSAVTAAVLGRLVDSFGPWRVLTGATLFSLACQVAFIAFLSQGAATGLLLLCAFGVGMANPQVGPMARVRWSRRALTDGRPEIIGPALGYEGAADETGFVVGPILSSTLVALLGGIPAAVTIAVLTLLFQGAFIIFCYLDRETWRPIERSDDDLIPADLRPMPWLALVAPTAGCLANGILFGAVQTGLTAMLTARAQEGVIGIVYGAMGVGSALSSVVVGRLSHRLGAARATLMGAAFVGTGALILMTLPSWPVALTTAFLLGCGAGSIMVSSFGFVEAIAPRHRVATCMTVLATAVTLGVSAGAATAGQLAAVIPHAFWPLLAASLLAALAATGMRRRP